MKFYIYKNKNNLQILNRLLNINYISYFNKLKNIEILINSYFLFIYKKKIYSNNLIYKILWFLKDYYIYYFLISMKLYLELYKKKTHIVFFLIYSYEIIIENSFLYNLLIPEKNSFVFVTNYFFKQKLGIIINKFKKIAPYNHLKKGIIKLKNDDIKENEEVD